MNTLKIGNYRISRADDRNLQVEEFRLVKAKRGKYVKEARETEKWVFKGYFSNPIAACAGVLRYMTEDGVETSNDIPQLIETVKQSESTIQTAVKRSGLTLESFDKPVDGRGRNKTV